LQERQRSASQTERVKKQRAFSSLGIVRSAWQRAPQVKNRPFASHVLRINSASEPASLCSNHRFLGRPPFLPHPESFLRYLRVVVVPPFLPMQRGQIIVVRGWRGQYVAMATHILILERALSSLRLALFSSSTPSLSPFRQLHLVLADGGLPSPGGDAAGTVEFRTGVFEAGRRKRIDE
jgi:hypothetical protein